jgi:DNA replication protein DnaC
MEMIREICGNYAHTFGPKSGNMLFTGAPGLGKTFLSACIAREVSDLGFSVVYDTAAHIFQRFECEKFGRESALEENAWADVGRYLRCDLLIMDDLGTEMRTEFVQAAFYRIVNDRLLHRRKTVLSTNLDIEDIARRYGDAVLSRLRGEYQLLRFFGEDIRLLKRK